MENSPQLSSDDIFTLLEHEIISLSIKPGQTISESLLSERFGVSRTPIRAALRRLADRGLVDITPYKGTRVALLCMDEIEQMIYMRSAVEGAVLADFAAEPPPMLMEKIRYIIRKQEVLVEGAFEHSQFYALDSQLHEVWFTHTEKLHIWELIKHSQVHYTRFRMLDIVAAQQYAQIIAEHKQLFDALAQQDAASVRKIIHTHLYGGILRVQPRIASEFPSYFKDTAEQGRGMGGSV